MPTALKPLPFPGEPHARHLVRAVTRAGRDAHGLEQLAAGQLGNFRLATEADEQDELEATGRGQVSRDGLRFDAFGSRRSS